MRAGRSHTRYERGAQTFFFAIRAARRPSYSGSINEFREQIKLSSLHNLLQKIIFARIIIYLYFLFRYFIRTSGESRVSSYVLFVKELVIFIQI